MKPFPRLLYIEADEEITDLVDRLRELAEEETVTFVVPERARALQSPMSFKLLRRYADSYGKRVNIISSEPRLQTLSQDAGFMAYESLDAYEGGTPSGAAPSEGNGHVAIEPAVERAPAAVATAVRETPRPSMSAPPRSAGPTPIAPPSPRRRRPPALLIGAVAAVLLGLIAAIVLLPSATVVMSVSGAPLSADLQLSGSTDAPSGVADRFVTQVVNATETQTASTQATGQQPVPAVAAQGEAVFTLTCFLCQGATLPRGLTVRTPDGKRYATQQTATISGPSGSTSVPIKAVAVGAVGNTDANTISTIEGNTHPDELKVNNPAAVSGGADARTATVVQQSDIDAAKQALLDQLNPKVEDDLNSKAKGAHLLPVGQPQVQLTTDHKVKDEASSFSVTISVTQGGLTFDNGAVQKLLQDALRRKVPAGQELTSDRIHTSYDVAQASPDGDLTLRGHADGFAVPIFSREQLRARLKGQSPSHARALLLGQPDVVDVIVRQQPFGLPWLPFFSSRITVQIQEVPGTGSSGNSP